MAGASASAIFSAVTAAAEVGGDREAGDAGRLLRGHVLGEAEPQHLELALREQAAGAFPKVVATVVALGGIGRRVSGAGHVFGHFLPALGVAEVVERGAARDGEQPVDHRPRTVETRQVLIGLDEGLLRQVLGVVPVARELIQEIEDAAAVQRDELVEGLRLAADGRADERRLLGRSDRRRGLGRGGGIGIGGNEGDHRGVRSGKAALAYLILGSGIIGLAERAGAASGAAGRGSRTLTANFALPSGSFTNVTLSV